MADRESHGRELVFCHQCQNEWNRDEHGLECPECHSEFVEVVSPIKSFQSCQDTPPPIVFE